jgi:hypothetical protein
MQIENEAVTKRQVINSMKKTHGSISDLLPEINRALKLATIDGKKEIKIYCGCMETEPKEYYKLTWGRSRINDEREQQIGLYLFSKRTIQEAISLYRDSGWEIKTSNKVETIFKELSYTITLPVVEKN